MLTRANRAHARTETPSRYHSSLQVLVLQYESICIHTGTGPVPVRVYVPVSYPFPVTDRHQSPVPVPRRTMPASTCKIDVPEDPASLLSPPLERPLDVGPWGADYVRALRHSHRWQFSPINTTNDGWAAAIRASQFGNCSRLLLVEDDLVKAGLGFTAKIWTAALLVAMRDNRVLMEVRMVRPNATVEVKHNLTMVRQHPFERPRWCDREPYTLQCLYMPWTHCQLPPADATVIRPGGRPLKVNKWPHNEPYVITGLGRIHRQGIFWHGAKSAATREAGRFLFRPRPWITAAADCVMREAGLEPRGFINVHIRHSVEKQAEGARLGVSLPGLDAYESLGLALSKDAGTRKLFVQTASPVALLRAISFSAQHQFHLFYTNNSRSENDAWGGWKGGSEMEQAAVAAINAHIGSKALVTVSPELSLWTNFLLFSFGEDGQRIASKSVCCPLEHCRGSITRGGSHMLSLCASPELLAPGKLQETHNTCRMRAEKGVAAHEPA